MSFDLPEHFVYQPQSIEFVTAAAQVCRVLEQAKEFAPSQLVAELCQRLPVLYSKATALQTPSSDDAFLEQFVYEDDYYAVQSALQTALGGQDTFLDSFHPDMAYSEMPVISTISEYLADTYQELKDMAGNFQTGDEAVMQASLSICKESFTAHWGRKLLSALCALHAIDPEQLENNK